MSSLILFFCSLLTNFWLAFTTNPIVTISDGVLKGSWENSTNGRSYASFQGIPYAAPPVAENRFKMLLNLLIVFCATTEIELYSNSVTKRKALVTKDPQPPQPWNDTWDATGPPTACIQYDVLTQNITGIEDCLYLSVYTPNLQSDAMLPVLVYIHGGAFMYGNTVMYGPANIMDWDMVVVMMQYRLGPFGFLSTGDDVVPGNNGLKDQSVALRWVKNNVAMFGGNPDSITLSGVSAGGASVHYHYLSPMSRGLFERGISYSGSAFCPWALSIKPEQNAKKLASLVYCPTDTNEELVDCLTYKTAEDIVKAQMQMVEWKVKMFTPFTPVVEAPEVQNPFLQQYPYEATSTGSMANVSLITSICSDEGLYMAAPFQSESSILPELEENWDQLASTIFVYNDTLPLSRRSEVAQSIKEYYLGGSAVSQDTFSQLVKALSDRLFISHVGKMAQLHATNSLQPTYVFRYAFRGAWSVSNLLANNNVNYGVSHGDEVLRIFKVSGLDTTEPDDRAIVEELISIIYSYAVSGTPKLNRSETVWLPIKPAAAELDYLDLLSPTESEMKSTTDFGNNSFWDQIGFNENENYCSSCETY